MLPAGDVMRPQMILPLADGVSYQKIQYLLDITAPTIAALEKSFLAASQRFNGRAAIQASSPQ